MIKKSEVMKLLTVIAATERSGWVPTPEDASIWQAFAKVGQWESFEAALQAYIVFRSANPKWRIQPGDITQTLEEVRRESSRSFELAIERVPDHVRDAEDFDAAYMAWIKGEAAKHRAKAIEAFVAGQGPGQRAIEA
jgi:hypothetical protein